ncbi:GNAT family N-acetyltransferase [Mucilaginibacter ximonensis]|uniref:GNAT family N-acetyltransferase n=2 Tax=Mucilaginibacter ximonensis TaxID=538021 RepID=A0ABW5Y927_9SPHI
MIRKAKMIDAPPISTLLAQLGYPADSQLIAGKIDFLIDHPDHELLVYEQDERVVGFIDMHFISQLTLGDFAHITYFCVDADTRGSGIGAVLLERAEQLAKDRHCDRVFLHCNEHRVDAHRFYERNGYTESPKYYLKKLTDYAG